MSECIEGVIADKLGDKFRDSTETGDTTGFLKIVLHLRECSKCADKFRIQHISVMEQSEARIRDLPPQFKEISKTMLDGLSNAYKALEEGIAESKLKKP